MAFDPDCNDCNEIAQEIQVVFIIQHLEKLPHMIVYSYLINLEKSPFSSALLLSYHVHFIPSSTEFYIYMSEAFLMR